MSLLERYPRLRQASMELGPEDVSLLERYQRVLCTGFNGVGILRCVEVSSFQRVLCNGVRT